MKTNIKNTDDTVVVTLDGRLDYETSVPLRENLSRLLIPLSTDKAPKIILNLEHLEFVGSSGISSFIQILKEFNKNSPTKPKYCNVSSEFKKMIKAFDDQEIFDFYESEDRARKSFDQ